ncbi:hypothetical protein [Rhizobium sp. SYY.PMSO]|uniref:hypothetical protein n=1 Tax=Rhizobium sp. SYY.PMSO TaxID=3382192 RepID=UPI00398F9856
MPDYTIETSYRLPAYRHRTYQADTVVLACRKAIEDGDWSGEKLSYEDAGETYVSGIWNGVDAAYSGPAIPIARRPEAGEFRVLQEYGVHSILLYLAKNRPDAERWVKESGHINIRLEEVTAEEVCADVIEGRAA